MQCDVARCIIFISDKAEHLDKERSDKNSLKEVILWFQVTANNVKSNATKKIQDKLSFHMGTLTITR